MPSSLYIGWWGASETISQADCQHFVHRIKEWVISREIAPPTPVHRIEDWSMSRVDGFFSVHRIEGYERNP